MKYSELTEAPIGTLDVSDMDQPGSFSDVDRKLLSNRAHLQKIKKHFDLNTFDFDLYFINQVGVKYMEPNPDTDESKRPFRSTQRYMSDMKAHMGTISPATALLYGVTQHDPEVITIIYLSNANEENPIPMTPWMVAHRFAHVLTEDMRIPPGAAKGLSELNDFRMPLLKDFNISVPITKFMTNRSAKNGSLSLGEFREEMISQYLTSGRVSLKAPSSQYDKAYIERVSNRCNVIIDHIMNACMGQIFVSV